jgi:hypothetical protein
MDKLFAPGFPGLRVKVALVREGKPRRKPKAITGPQDAFRLIRRIGKEDREHFIVILLNPTSPVCRPILADLSASQLASP